ncbi:coiled-coil domain-containing protein 86-like [Myxocyprinus asiaticus]|uniref:coiled-coil domain-containing protein 86-like n=1 Tax=Myxocyprinus asiaticus TaxID=70543 RepID=UPI0022218BB9|nr:coiled-coil domain-containing protein 86-like [Myxocyprinus asiaticus]
MMSVSRNKEIHTDSGDGVIKPEGPDTEEDPPVISRTRSGRRLQAPTALLDSGAPTTKTPVRRTRKSVIREDPAESRESPSGKPADESTAHATDQCAMTEAVGPDAPAPAPTEEKQIELIVSDQTSEKENLVNVANNRKTGSTCTTDPEKKRAKKRTRSESSEIKSKMVPLGKPKSGRVWKDRNKQRFSALLRDKPLRTSWEKKMEAKREKQLVKQYHQQLKDEKAKEKEDKKMRRAENLRRRAENERKAEIVQVIKNTAKIKRMKKKQLRKIEKRDTLSALQITPPSVKKRAGKTNSSS